MQLWKRWKEIQFEFRIKQWFWFFFFFEWIFRDFEQVRDSMHSAILMNKTEILDAALSEFCEVNIYYYSLGDNLIMLIYE